MSTPMRSAVLGATFMSFAFGVIGGSVGLNALIKANQQKSFVRANATPGAVVVINTDDVFHSGVVLTVTCALIGISSIISLNISLLPSLFSTFLTRSFIRLQALVLGFWSLWTFATLIPFDVFFAKRQARITATLGGVAIPQRIIDALSAQLGVSPVYRKQGYLRLVAILPWFAILFGFISTAVLFAASSRAGTSSSSRPTSADQSMMVEKPALAADEEKKDMTKKEEASGNGSMKEKESVSVEEVA